MIYSNTPFTFTKVFEDNYLEIKKEFNSLSTNLLHEWHEKKLYNEGWYVFPIYNFPNGGPIKEAIELCPQISELVEKYVPTHGAVGFSILSPGTILNPHKGYQGDFLRLHVGIDIPKGDCGLNVDGIDYRWKNGEAIVFDDRLEHYAWNKSQEPRVVLLIDFIPDI